MQLQVIWKRLYKCSSSKDVGTLYQLRNLINRRNVVSDPTRDVTACEEFFLLVVEAHILYAAMDTFEMTSIDDVPSNTDFFPEEATNLDSIQRRNVLLLGVKALLSKFVDLSFSEPSAKPDEKDHVQEYVVEVFSLGLLLMEFADGIREGDGQRILRCWCFFLPLFKATNRTNYSIEAFTLLAQHDFIFSERLKQQLIYERTINTHGHPSKNIPCDLFMEHLNRECKEAIGSLGSNIRCQDSVVRIGKSIGQLIRIINQYDDTNEVKGESGKHSTRSNLSDLSKIVNQLATSEAFQYIPGRKHVYFPKFSSNSTRQLNLSKLQLWFKRQFQELLFY